MIACDTNFLFQGCEIPWDAFHTLVQKRSLRKLLIGDNNWDQSGSTIDIAPLTKMTKLKELDMSKLNMYGK
jgi:hypothetical protein